MTTEIAFKFIDGHKEPSSLKIDHRLSFQLLLTYNKTNELSSKLKSKGGNRMAELLREIKAKITNLDFQLIPDDLPEQIIVSGDVVKEIFYVTKAGLVKKQDAVLPFILNFELQSRSMDIEPQISGEIEHISYRLFDRGKKLEQQYIISITLAPEELNAKRQHFLIQSIDTFIEEGLTKKVTIPDEKVKNTPKSTLPKKNPVIPLPDLTALVDKKVANQYKKLEKELRKELQIQIEEKVQQQLATIARERDQQIAKKRESQRKKSVFQKIHGYKTKVYSF